MLRRESCAAESGGLSQRAVIEADTAQCVGRAAVSTPAARSITKSELTWLGLG